MHQFTLKRYKYYLYGTLRRDDSKKSFYEQYLPEKDLYSVLKVVDHKSVPVVKAAQKINTYTFPFNGSQLGLWLKKGSAHYTFVKQYRQFKHKVKIYRQKIGPYPYFLNVHFINGKLLYVNLCFHEKTQSLEASVKETLRKKYGNFPEQRSVLICDESGSKLKVDSDIYLNLYYFSGNQSLIKKLKQEWSGLEANIISMKNLPLLRLEELL